MPTGIGIAAGASLLGGLLGGPTTKSTTTTTPTFSTAQNQVQSAVSGTLQNEMNNPANLQPLETAAASQVDANYAGAQTALTAQMAARGFGNSGKLVTNAKNLQIAQAGAQGNLASQFAGMQIAQNNNVVNQSEAFGFADPGSTSTTIGNTEGSLAAGLSGMAGTASMMYTLNNLMGGGGGGGPDQNTPTFNPADGSEIYPGQTAH